MTKVTARELSMAAMAEVASLPAEDAAKLVGDAGALFVDVREPNELGGRSALATKSLQDMGVEGVVYVKGGLKALKELGAPTEG